MTEQAPPPLTPVSEDWERALCVVAHPDDLEFGGAAAVARWTGQGKQIVYLLTIDKCKFRKPAGPGDRIEFHIRKIRKRMQMGWYEAKAMVDGVVIAEAEVGAMITPGTPE